MECPHFVEHMVGSVISLDPEMTVTFILVMAVVLVGLLARRLSRSR